MTIRHDEELPPESPNPCNSKLISLHPLKPEDAIRAALMTAPLPREGKRRRKKASKAP